MAADLFIHAIPDDFPEETVYNFLGHALGSKHFSWARVDLANNDPAGARFNRILSTDKIWVGEVSWLKAALFDDEASYIPAPIAFIALAIGEDLPILTPPVKAIILMGLDLQNTTNYRLTERTLVADWLDAHMGQRLFTVSW